MTGKSDKQYALVDKTQLGKVKSKVMLQEIEIKNLEKTALAATKEEPF
jgi:hypothetical protein